MPYFALLRNLRNIEQTGDPNLIARACDQLVNDDPSKHRVLPFRFVSAYTQVATAQVKQAVSRALERAVENIPTLAGRTLIVVDHSRSMGQGIGSHKFMGDLFAACLVKRNGSDVMVFGTDAGMVPTLNPDDSLTTLMWQIEQVNHGYGTDFTRIFKRLGKSYDRIVIFSDMQAWIGYHHPGRALEDYQVRAGIKPFIYSFDLAGYGTTQFISDRIMQLAGFSEKIFDVMKVIEQDKNALINKIEAVEI